MKPGHPTNALLKRMTPPTLAAIVGCMAAAMSVSAQSQPQYTHVGTLPDPTASERGEVFDPDTGTLYSFIFWPRIGTPGDTKKVYAIQVPNEQFTSRTVTASPTQNYWGRGVAFGGQLYFNGTIDKGSLSRRAPIQADGLLGAWTTMADLPTTNGFRSLHQTFSHNQRLYVVGGWRLDGQPYHDDVWHAPIQTGGGLGAFVPSTPLPRGVAGHSAAVSPNGRVYVCAETNLYTGQIQPDGGIQAWTPQQPIPGLNHWNKGNTAAAIVGNLLVIVDATNTFALRMGADGNIEPSILRIPNPETFTLRSVFVYQSKPYVSSLSGKIYRIDHLPQGEPPSMASQPSDAQAAFESDATFSVIAQGEGPLTYQWFMGTNTIPGATSATYTVTKVQPRDAGSYRVVASNPFGSGTSSPAILPVSMPYTYRREQGVWTITGYTGPGGVVRIPSTIDGTQVSKIADKAFAFRPGITRLELPGTLEAIGTEAFIGCSGLTSTVFAHGIKSIGQLALSGVSLGAVTIPSTVTNIGPGAFTWNSLLVGIDVDPSSQHYRSIDGVLFDAAQILLVQFPASRSGSDTVPSTVRRIGGWAFNACWRMTQVLLSDQLESIGPAAFSNCEGLRQMTLPATVNRLDEFAFGQCSNLGDVLFQGPPPDHGVEIFYKATKAVAVYRMGVAGWTSSYAGIPTRMANAQATTAVATPRVVAGFVVVVDLSDLGGGYTNEPRVRIFGGGGSGATAVATLTNGSIASVRVIQAGSGYTNSPIVVIDPPVLPVPSASLKALFFGPNVPPVIQLDCDGLSPYDLHQIEFAPELGTSWLKSIEPFLPTTRTNTQYSTGQAPQGFYRVRRVE